MNCKSFPGTEEGMGTAAGAVGEVLGLPEPSATFLLALFSAQAFAIIYKCGIIHLPSTLQNLYFTVSGGWIMCYVYGFDMWHSLVDITAVYLVLCVCGGSVLSVCLTWVITMGHLVAGYVHLMYMSEVHPISWTIPHCVLVLKLIGLSYNLYDGQKKKDKVSEEFRELSIGRLPSIFDVLGFCYFYGSVLAGPQIPFTRHVALTEGRLFDREKTPSSIPTGLQRLLVGVVVAVLYSFLNQYFPISALISDEYAEKPIVVKLFLVYACGKIALWRYIGVWLIAEGSCIVTGISYEGKDKDGRVSWHALANIHFVDFETSVILENLVVSFNRNTNKWLSWYVHKRLKFLGNKMLSWMLTLLFVGVWHGVWPGYYLCFSLEVLEVMAERSFIQFSKRLLGCSLSDMPSLLRVPLTLAAYVAKSLMLVYPLSLFMILSWESCYKFMSSTYFYCHALTFSWLLLYHTLLSPLIMKGKRREKLE